MSFRLPAILLLAGLRSLLRAQCDGTEVIVHTFSGIAAWDLERSLGSRPMDTRPAGWSCVDCAAQPRASASMRWNWCTPCSMVGENRPVV
jgi:hypothetical protein